MNENIKSNYLFKRANNVIPGGVNSPARAFSSVGESPVFIKQAKGPYLYDVDDNQYIDYVGSWGPMILGHADEDVTAAVAEQVTKSLSYGAPCESEVLLAEEVIKLVPSIEQIRFVNSGTEATMSAIRLARAFTKRDKIIKFSGCYHGHADHLLANAGSGLLTHGSPSSPGVPEDFTKHTLTAAYNDIASVETLFNHYQDQIAGVIIEPIAGNMNMIKPSKDFLASLRKLCDHHQALLIFDEVMAGFRVGLHGAQGLYNIKPDLTALGKIIGGGMPVGAFGGRKAIMQMLSPLGSVYQAGTLSGNPTAMCAGLKTLQKIQQANFFPTLAQKTQQLCFGLESEAKKHGIPFHTVNAGGMFGMFFTDQKSISSFEEVKQCSTKQFAQFFHYMFNNGIYFAPSAFEAGFMSITHSDDDIQQTIKIAGRCFETMTT